MPGVLVTIRPARSVDAKRIFDIYLKSLEGLSEEGYEWFEAMVRVRSRRRKILVAELGGEVVGFAVAYRYRGAAYVDSIAVEPRLRGHGIGSALLDELERELRGEGAELVALSVKDENKRALNFYLRRGYSVRGVILTLMASIEALPEELPVGYSLRRGKAGEVELARKFRAATWWSTMTEPVDRLIYRKFRRAGDEAVLAYRGRLRGVAEFSLGREVSVNYIALSSYQATSALRALLSGLRAAGTEAGAEEVAVPVDGSKRKFIEALLEAEFKTSEAEYLLVKELSE